MHHFIYDTLAEIFCQLHWFSLWKSVSA